MRNPNRTATCLVAAAAACAAFSSARSLTAADGTPDVHGHWTGSAKAREFYLDPGEENGRDRFDVALDITQTGGNVVVNATLTTDEGPQVFVADGFVGRDTLWALSTDATRTFLLTGHIGRGHPKMTGLAVLTNAGEVEEMTLKLRQ